MNNGVRKSVDDLKLADVVKHKGERKEILYKPKLSNLIISNTLNIICNECKLRHLGQTAGSCKTVFTTQERA